MQRQTIRFRVTGTKRLLMHAGRLADPLDPITQDLAKLTSKRPKTIADHRMISKVEWFGGLWLHDGLPCIPAEALLATLIGGAKVLKRGPQAAAGLSIENDAILVYDGPTDVDELWENGNFSFRCGVKVGVNAKTMPRLRTQCDCWLSIRVIKVRPIEGTDCKIWADRPKL
jgi:hypothetical protein